MGFLDRNKGEEAGVKEEVLLQVRQKTVSHDSYHM